MTTSSETKITFKETDLLMYTRENGVAIIGQIDPYGWDFGDYGNRPTITIDQPDGSSVTGIPVEKVKVIDQQMFEDIRGLNFGIYE